MTKDEIRQQMRERRHAITSEERRAAGKAIAENVMGHEIHLLLRAWRVSLYLSTTNEIPTRYIARAFWEAGRDVCVPAWSTSESTYRLYALDPRTKLIKGHHGIREPEVRIPVFPWDVDAFILPGLAFDGRGGRLGFGKGHYDAILSKALKTSPKIGVCYDWQVAEEPLPQEEHDIPMDWVVTDSRIIHCAGNRKKAAALEPPPPADTP